MTLVKRCTLVLPIIFWQIVTLAVFGTGLAFLFWPDDVDTLFVTSQSTSLLRYMGVLFMLSAAGFNQVTVDSTETGLFMRKSTFVVTLLMYMLASVAGIVVLTNSDVEVLANTSSNSTDTDGPLFIEEYRFTLYILYGLFLGGLAVALLGTCGGYCRFQAGATSLPEVHVEVAATRQSRPLPKSRAELMNRR